MGIEITEKSKETRVKQASMLHTHSDLYLDSNKHLYTSIPSAYSGADPGGGF